MRADLLAIVGVLISLEAPPALSARPLEHAPQSAEPRVVAAPIRVEFDLPTDFDERDATGGFVIRGIRIGFFQPTVATPIATRDVRRDAIEVDGGVGRLPLPDLMPRGYGRVFIRLQSLSATGAGPWSEPSPAVTLPERPPPSGPPRPLSLSDVERFPVLSEALQQVLGRRPTAGEVATFRRAEDLATAVVLSRRYEIAFPDLCKILRGPPPLTLRGAIRQLLPSLDHIQVVREASLEARALLGGAELSRPPD
jgi:hypothetical protein